MTQKPTLSVEMLERAGFAKVSAWIVSEGQLTLASSLSREPGVYAFATQGKAVYVGLAASGLANRCKFYARPGGTQRTSIRLNSTMVRLLTEERTSIDIYAAHPEDAAWNGLPVSMLAGLEAGIIKTFNLPWNLRGV